MKRTLKTTISLLLAFVLLVGCAACSSDKKETAASDQAGAENQSSGSSENKVNMALAPASGDKNHLIVGVASDLQGLDPMNITLNEGHSMLSQVYEQLVYRNEETKELEGSLAETWEYDETGTKITFHIRKGVKFHNGDELKANDVLFSYQYAAEQGYSSALLEHVLIDECSAPDDYTFVLATDGVYSPQISLCEMNQLSILCERAVKEADYDFNSCCIGTGAYKLSSWKTGDRIELEAFDDYWGTPANIKNVTLRVITDDAVRAMELEAGSIDLMYNVSKADYDRLASSENVNVYNEPSLNTRVLQFNCAGIFADQKLREAVAYAVDTAAATQASWGPVASFDVSGLLVPGIEGAYDTGVRAQDQEKAKALMAEAGYADGFECVIICDATNANIMMAQIVQSQLDEVGIKAAVESLETATLQDRRFQEDGYDIHVYGWTAATYNADKTLRRWVNTSYEFDSFHWDNQKYSDLVDEAAVTVDEAKRDELYKEAQQILYDEVPVIPTSYKNLVVAVRANVQGFVIRQSDERHQLKKVSFVE